MLDPLTATSAGIAGHEASSPTSAPTGSPPARSWSAGRWPPPGRRTVRRAGARRAGGVRRAAGDLAGALRGPRAAVGGLRDLQRPARAASAASTSWTPAPRRAGGRRRPPRGRAGHPGRLPAHPGRGRRPRQRLGPPAVRRGGRAGPRAGPASGGGECVFTTLVAPHRAGCSADLRGTPPTRPRASPSSGGSSRTSRLEASRRTRSGASATSWPRATSSARRSTSRRPTPGAGRSCTGSRPRCTTSPSGSSRAAPSRTRPSSSTRTPRARSRARRPSAAGCRTSPTAPSTSSPACTSTSPTRSAASSAASPRPRTAGSTTPVRARTSRAPAACGGRCLRASPGSARGRGHHRLPRGRAPAITSRSPRPTTAPTC